MRISVLAAGAWGSALALAFSRRHEVTLWSHEADVVAEIAASRENRRFLPGFVLPEKILVINDLKAAFNQAEILLIATPIAGLRPTLMAIREQYAKTPPPPMLWVCKGFEVKSGKLPHGVLEEVFPDPSRRPAYGTLSGPSFAQGVAAGLPTAITCAAHDMAFARQMAAKLNDGALRIYASDDLIGVEVGGALKNILAIATGVCDGLTLGDNARAALMTRGLAEIARFGKALGGRKETFMGLAGAGDLILTCTGNLSRNRAVGLGLAAGKALPDILAELGHVAEGVPTALEVARLAEELGIEMPITQAVTLLLQGQLAPREAVANLLARNPAEE
ncbi:MAG: NAD(P)-dependent glycerol-3-phosphate dehydrogenase [Zoogloeaceae bacterium]|jgi:glycerol-3-phosphate dehydrogenase (NAD(P)+)|nr:NAD(P)-dependent glycerol-3-phosphate dehydrogenase [Zoogloeaceae bacterium]